MEKQTVLLISCVRVIVTREDGVQNPEKFADEFKDSSWPKEIPHMRAMTFMVPN